MEPKTPGLFGRALDRLLERLLGSFLDRRSLGRPHVFGDPSKLDIHPTAVVNNALLNLSSGRISIGKDTFFGHDVRLLTGTHDVAQRGMARQKAIPPEGRDILVGEGVWVATGATVLGPCRIGDHAVVCAGSVVRQDVPAGAVVAGVPATVIKVLEPPR